MISQQDQALTIEIQPADLETPEGLCRAIELQWSGVPPDRSSWKARPGAYGGWRIGCGLGRFEMMTVHLDVVTILRRPGAQFPYHLAVDSHTPFGDQGLRLPSRCQPCLGNDLL